MTPPGGFTLPTRPANPGVARFEGDDRCAWPGCYAPALCASGNFGGKLVCGEHFMVTNGAAARDFPMLDGPPIPWALAERIYAETYSKLHGKEQTLDRMAERGGFGWSEVTLLYADAIRRGILRERPWRVGRPATDRREVEG